ncbi:hypothetical protein LTR95_017270, partial [Oleoguttula sp. CCFEE 5521]
MRNLKVKVEDLLTFFPGPGDHDADQQNVTFIRFLCNLASENPHTNSLVGVMRTLNAHSAAREDEKNMLSFFSLSILVLAKLTDNQVQFTEAMDYFDEGRDAKLSAQKEKYFYEILNASARTPAFYDAMPTPDSRAANTPNIRRAALTGKKRPRSAVQEAHEQRSPEKRRRLSTTVSEAGSLASDAPSDLHESHERGMVSPCTQNLHGTNEQAFDSKSSATLLVTSNLVTDSRSRSLDGNMHAHLHEHTAAPTTSAEVGSKCLGDVASGPAHEEPVFRGTLKGIKGKRGQSDPSEVLLGSRTRLHLRGDYEDQNWMTPRKRRHVESDSILGRDQEVDHTIVLGERRKSTGNDVPAHHTIVDASVSVSSSPSNDHPEPHSIRLAAKAL